MPISALPEDTIRTIGSTQVLTDSASVVKELVDNALDARASAIFIEISANTLDIIQVKDNGYGVAPIDRPLVCKRYCTSKISSFDDIASIGGESLGFRGEALASAAEMSGSLVVTTRIEGEVTATTLKIGRQGQIESEERASHPVGTSVRVVDFLKNLPVRRQTALKLPFKTLSNITRTLRAYAIARPAIRFSVKVLKAKNEKSNWTYAPKAGGSVQDAATKVVGKKVIEQCQWKIWNSHERSPQNEVSEALAESDDTFIIEALLANPACDISSITRVGQYFSIDSRPVSCGRGTLKTISGLYKSYLRSAWAKDNGDKINDPFICMNIVCPPGSYDANIEPAKDDVLFTDASKVLEIAESFLKNVYGELQWPSKAPGDSGRAMSRSQGFDALLARKPHPVAIPKSQHHPLELAKNNIHGDSDAVLDISPVSSTVTGNGAGLVPEIETSIEDGSAYSMPEGTGLSALGNPSPDKVGRPNMYAADDDDEMNLFVAQDHHGSRPQTPVAEDEAGLRDVRVSNPWSIAKVNAASRPHLRQQSNVGQLMTPVRTREDHQAGDHGTSPMTTIGDTQPFPQTLPTPLQSLRDSSDRRTASSSPERFPYPLSARNSRSGEHALQMHRAANKERYGGGALDTWVQKSINGYIDAPSSEAEPEKDLITVPESDTQTRDFISARLLPTGTPLSAIPTPPTRPRRQSPQKQTGKVVQKPFTSPLTDDSVWFDVGQGPKSRRPPPDRIKGKQSTFTPQGRLQLSPSATTTSSPERRAQPKLSSSSRLPSPTTTSSSPDHPVHPDLASSLEYETRKAIASQQHRASLLLQKRQKLASDAKATGHRGTSNSPHQNRYNRAVAALHQEDQASTKGHQSPQKKSVFEAGDPRQYWMRVQEREQVLAAADGNISPSRIPSAKRRKTAMLPLEVVREEWSVRDLVLPLPPIDLSTLASGVKATRKLDEYISSGTTTTNLVLNSAQIFHTVRAWEEQLRTLVHDTYKIVGTDSQPAQLRVELWPLLQEHATKYPSSNAAVMEKDAAENT